MNANNLNESINLNDWIEESIRNKHIKYYEYEKFSNIKEIGSGGFARVYRANWKNAEQYLALKSFYKLDDAIVKEIVREVITKHHAHLVYIYIYLFI
jgi:hypothetical protein